MLYEDLQDTAIIIQNILNQPLSVRNCHQDLTLLSAAISFDAKGSPASHLQQLMQTFIEYRDPTETLIRELDILSEEIQV